MTKNRSPEGPHCGSTTDSPGPPATCTEVTHRAEAELEAHNSGIGEALSPTVGFPPAALASLAGPSQPTLRWPVREPSGATSATHSSVSSLHESTACAQRAASEEVNACTPALPARLGHPAIASGPTPTQPTKACWGLQGERWGRRLGAQTACLSRAHKSPGSQLSLSPSCLLPLTVPAHPREPGREKGGQARGLAD